jgi:GNAT superfamily N-acetyltransferase
MESEYVITAARPCDLPFLPAIELAAAQLLAGHAPESVLQDTTSPRDFQRAHHKGHLWVALHGDEPVGFAHVELLEPAIAHLKELDVHPKHGRRGIGTRLVLTVYEWARSSGFTYVTLTTFRDVPWNMPFYAKLGFEVIPPDKRSPRLLSILREEIRRGLDAACRVAMQRSCER